MIVRSVKLTNILSHESTEVFFPDGVVSIVGPNGAGKSSIIDSVYVALFSDAKPDIRGGKKEYIVMRGRKRGEIAVAFEVGGSRYLVVREVSTEGVSDAYLYVLEGDKRRLRAKGISQVVSEIGRILGLTTTLPTDLRKLVRGTILSLQDELTEIIDIRDSERREWILSLLGLSYLEKALESVKAVVSEKSKLEGELRNELRNLERVKKDLEELRRKVSELTTKAKEVEGRVSELRFKRDRLSTILSTLDEAIELGSKLRIAMIVSRIKELNELISNLEQLNAWDGNEYSKLLNELKKRRGEVENIRKQYGVILGEVRSKLGVTVGSLDELSKLLNELKFRREELKDLISGKGALKDLYRVYTEKFEASNRCPICGSLIDDPKLVRERLIKELVNLNNSIRDLNVEYLTTEAKLRAIEGYVEKVKDLVSKEAYLITNVVNELESRVDNLKSLAMRLCREAFRKDVNELNIDQCVDLLNRSKEDLQRFKSELEVLLRSYGSVPDVTVDEANVDSIRSKLREILISLGFNLTTITNIKDVDDVISKLLSIKKNTEMELRRFTDELSKLEADLKSLNDRIIEYTNIVGKFENEVKEREVRVRELERRVKAYNLVEEFASRFLGKNGLVAKELTKVVRSELEKRVNTILLRLGLRPITINEEFQIGIKVLGGELPVSNASGGEKVGISIALRLALAELVMGRSPTTLILDEPTVYLDEDRRTHIFRIISELSKSLRQVIVVTHDEDVISISDSVIRVENVNDVSRVYSV